MSPKGPDFLLVGAPKCGTTSLDRYLAEHPEIFMARKEQHFWGSDLAFRGRRRAADAYFASFETHKPAKLCGESSVWYLFSTRAAKEIHAHNPEAKIVVMLRNPPDMIYSLHNQNISTGDEDIEDFGEALAAESDRTAGRRIPKTAINLCALRYREVPRYAEQIERYFDVFGRDRVHVILYDDFADEPLRVYRDVCRFLDVEDGFVPVLEVHNPSKRLRSLRLMRALNVPTPALRWTARALLPVRPIRRLLLGGLVNAVETVNVKPVRRPPLDLTLRAELSDEFRPEIERLAHLVGRDLAAWLPPASA